MKKTLFLSAILGAALCSSAFGAAVLIPNSDDTTQTVNATEWRLIYTPGAETTYAGTLNLNRDGGAWCGPANSTNTDTDVTTQPSVIHLTGNLIGSTNISLNEYNNSQAVANAIFTLSGTNSTYSGEMMLSHGGNINNSYTQVTLEDMASLRNATIAFQNDRAHTILNVAGNATIGGLSTTQTDAWLTSTSTTNTLTLDVAANKNLSYAGKVGDTNTSYYGDTLATATTTTNSTTLSLAKNGEGKQTFTGPVALNSLTVNTGTIAFNGRASFTGAVTVNSGATLEFGVGGNNVLSFASNVQATDATSTLKITSSDFQYHAYNAFESFTGAVLITGTGTTLQIGSNATRFAQAASITLADGAILKGHSQNNFSRDLILHGGGIGDAGANEGFSGAITLMDYVGTDSTVKTSFVKVNSGKTVTLKGQITGTGSLTKQDAGTLTLEGTALKSFGSLKVAAGTVNINSATTLAGSLESGANIINVKANTEAGTFASTGNGGHINIANNATLSVSDKSSGEGVWIDTNAVVSMAQNSVLSVADGVLTLTGTGTEGGTVTRLNNSETAKLGVQASGNPQVGTAYLKNVKVTNADVVYAGSGTLYLGSMQGGNLSSTGNIEFAGTDSTIGSLTLSGQTITLGTDAEHDNDLTITTSLAVSGTGSQVNANLVMNSGTMTFADGAVLTMGCDVTIGGDVLVYITGDIAAIRGGETVTIINGLTSLDTVNLGSAQIYVNDEYQSDFFLMQSEDGTSIVVAPEPATATLSLLALAALAARRKRH